MINFWKMFDKSKSIVDEIDTKIYFYLYWSSKK